MVIGVRETAGGSVMAVLPGDILVEGVLVIITAQPLPTAVRPTVA